MTETFHANIKLITGEEILAQVCLEEQNGEEFFILSDAITIDENTSIDDINGVALSGLTPKLWLRYGGEDMHIVRKSHVVTISELDKFGIMFYEKALAAARVSSPIKRVVPTTEHTGYLGNSKDVDFIKRCFEL